MKVHYGTVYLPHLNYTIRFRRYKHRPGIGETVAWIHHEAFGRCSIYLRENATVFTVVHELTHALQYICSDQSISFTIELEHTAGLMEYLLGRAFGIKKVNSYK